MVTTLLLPVATLTELIDIDRVVQNLHLDLVELSSLPNFECATCFWSQVTFSVGSG
jgi:hypothetical protein